MMTNFEKLNKIFIADDEEINLKYFRRFLSGQYEVYTTESCVDGLNLVKVFNPDIILLDVHMPGINGFEFCKKLKLDEDTKNIPVIFISSLANPEHIKMGLKVGAIDFISKPINKTETLARIKTHLAMGQVQRELSQSNKILDTSLKMAEQKFNVEKDQREKISAKLIESENRFKIIFDSTPEAIIIVSLDSGEIIDVNPAGCSLFGYSYDELIGINQNELLAPSKETIKQNYFETKDNSHKSSDTRMLLNTLIRKDGEKIPVQNSSKTILFEGELYIFSIIFDLSARKKMEKELYEAKERAEELNRLKGFFLANMSHELRTPLVGILGFSKLLEEEIEDEMLSNMAHSITVSGNRLLNTLKVLLEFSILESDEAKPEWHLINLDNIISDVINSCKNSYENRGLIVRFNRSEADISIIADYHFMTEVVFQLLNNAINYTHFGNITVSLGTKYIENKKCAIISIEDTGIGISEDKLSSIFDDFRQGSEGYSRDYEGLGLGLALVKKIVDMHNGTITVQSKEKEGSLFRVTLEMGKENQ